MTQSISDILAVAEDPAYHRVATARVPAVPQALRDEHAELEALLPTLTTDTIDGHEDAKPTADRLFEIQEAMDAATIEFRFRGIGHRAWSDLLKLHPPTKAQLADDRNLDHNPETFPYAAVAASCIDPVMTVEEVARLDASPLIDVLAWNELWSACIRANVAAANPKSVAAGLIRRLNEQSEKLPTTTESPDPSFSDE